MSKDLLLLCISVQCLHTLYGATPPPPRSKAFQDEEGGQIAPLQFTEENSAVLSARPANAQQESVTLSQHFIHTMFGGRLAIVI